MNATNVKPDLDRAIAQPETSGDENDARTPNSPAGVPAKSPAVNASPSTQAAAETEPADASKPGNQAPSEAGKSSAPKRQVSDDEEMQDPPPPTEVGEDG